jgi:hypothetical protein
MANFHHKPIKRFSLEGIIYDDASIARLKGEYLKLITSGMRISGHVPRIDIDPDFTIRYNEVTEYFEFKLSIYGIYIGKKQSECIMGVDGLAPIAIPQSKLKESLRGQESQSNQK